MESESTYAYSDAEAIVGLTFWLAALVLSTVAAFIVGKRRGVPSPGLAFIPFLGPWIVILRSIGTSAWWVLALFIPLGGGLVFAIWAAFTVPARHGRTRWWALPFLVPLVNLIAFLIYALTLSPAHPAPTVSASSASFDTPTGGPERPATIARQDEAPTSETVVSADSTKYCMNCGNALPATARFCSVCGESTDPGAARP